MVKLDSKANIEKIISYLDLIIRIELEILKDI